MTTVLGLAAIALYAFATIMILLSLTNAGAPARHAAVLGTAAVATLLHGTVLPIQLIADDGLRVGFSESLSLFSWQCALALVVAMAMAPLRHLGIVVFPVAALALSAALLVSTEPRLMREPTWTTVTHIVLSLLAWGLLSMAALQAIATAVMDRRLHHARPVAAALPPLQTMETLLFQLIAAGFFVLSLSLLSGLFFVEDLFAQHLVHKTLLSFIALLLFGVLLWGRWKAGWRGRQALKWTLAGYVTLVLAYFGSKLVLEVILGRHWAWIDVIQRVHA